MDSRTHMTSVSPIGRSVCAIYLDTPQYVCGSASVFCPEGSSAPTAVSEGFYTVQGGEADTDRHPWLGVAETRTSQVRETCIPWLTFPEERRRGSGMGCTSLTKPEKGPKSPRPSYWLFWTHVCKAHSPQRYVVTTACQKPCPCRRDDLAAVSW